MEEVSEKVLNTKEEKKENELESYPNNNEHQMIMRQGGEENNSRER
jgi:hypothetical protein